VVVCNCQDFIAPPVLQNEGKEKKKSFSLFYSTDYLQNVICVFVMTEKKTEKFFMTKSIQTTTTHHF